MVIIIYLLNRIVSEALQNHSPLKILYNTFPLVKLENALPK